ncbi:toll/interleukin-1 receptor-like protein [Prosopis cineraria]|uniref:toll/interleukin-1 receptor-like protein n=1 Tax=Prosopis cineraria TaxID=364024 RepID=UPI00240F1C40|nr:toll/interleukin-1 receptor-like protein [Prosopis cineraria]XP_054779749.1 toll/interleukin-1 receptor-like protein [Prosopis cineraria]
MLCFYRILLLLLRKTIERSNSPISFKRTRREDSMDLVNEPMNNQGLGNKHELVFMSFSRGEDTQESFPSCLYSSTRNAGISVIKDDADELNSENEISIELLRSMMEGSGFSIIIFSEHYASSRRCLEELVKIMYLQKVGYIQVVMTIFYGVDLLYARDQTPNFGQAFQSLIQRISPTKDQVLRWRTAFSETEYTARFVVPNSKSK